MSEYEILTLVLSSFAIVVIPVLVLLIRLVVKGTKLEDKLTVVADTVTKLSQDTDRRLRWLEENFWRRR